MKKILFVDDETRVLEGLRRMLRGLRHEWDMEFVASGEEALIRLNACRFDVVVSDMRMPGMDGCELLEQIRQQSPTTVRIVLSGHSDRQAVMRTVGVAHQFLSKPCDSQVVTTTVMRACRIRDKLVEPLAPGTGIPGRIRAESRFSPLTIGRRTRIGRAVRRSRG